MVEAPAVTPVSPPLTARVELEDHRMSPTQEYLHGRLPEALACWGAQLAAGRAWTDIEAEIVDCCESRVDLLTQLLVEAETVRSPVTRATRRTSSACAQRRTVWSVRPLPYAAPTLPL